MIKIKQSPRTTVTIRDNGLEEIMKAYGLKSKSKAAQYAVEETLRLHRIREADALRGTMKLDEDAIGCRHFSH